MPHAMHTFRATQFWYQERSLECEGVAEPCTRAEEPARNKTEAVPTLKAHKAFWVSQHHEREGQPLSSR